MAENIRASVVILLDRKTSAGDTIGLLPGRGSSKVCVVKKTNVPEQAIGQTAKGDRAATFRGTVTAEPVKQLTAHGVVTVYEVTLVEGSWAKPGGKPATAENATELPF